MNRLDVIILAFGISYGLLLIYLIDYGMQLIHQIYFLSVVVLVWIVYGVFAEKSGFQIINWGFLTLPIAIVLIYNIVNLISWKVNKREFRLKLQYSFGVDKGATNWLDSLFSFILILSFFIWPLSIAAILNLFVR